MMPLWNSDSRNGFIRRLYLLLSGFYILVMLSSLLALLNRSLRISLQDNINVFVIMAFAIIVMVFVGACFTLHRRLPWNLAMLGFFTIGYCLLMATVTAAAETYGTVYVFGTVAIVCLMIAMFSCFGKCNPLNWICVLLVLIVIGAFYCVAFFVIKGSPEMKAISLAASVIILLYLMLDTFLIMRRCRLKLEDDEVVFAFFKLHLDSFNLMSDSFLLCGTQRCPCWRRQHSDQRADHIHDDFVDVDPKKNTIA